jgi:hypothetical protein
VLLTNWIEKYVSEGFRLATAVPGGMDGMAELKVRG